jgi:hypothetical protein
MVEVLVEHQEDLAQLEMEVLVVEDQEVENLVVLQLRLITLLFQVQLLVIQEEMVVQNFLVVEEDHKVRVLMHQQVQVVQEDQQEIFLHSLLNLYLNQDLQGVEVQVMAQQIL